MPYTGQGPSRSPFAQIGTQQQAIAPPPVPTLPRTQTVAQPGAPVMGPTRPQYGAPTATRPYLPMVYANGPQVGSNMPTADAYGLGAAGINMPPDLNYAMNTPLIMRQRLLGNVPPNAAQQQAQGAGSEVYGVPRGVDARWWQQFAQEHGGRTPEQVYQRDGEYAVAHALSDKAWGDQFYRTYGRPPSEYDWKASYYDRNRAFYGG